MLSAIARMNWEFGVGIVSEVLAGTESEKTARWGLQQLTVFWAAADSSGEEDRGDAASAGWNRGWRGSGIRITIFGRWWS